MSHGAATTIRIALAAIGAGAFGAGCQGDTAADASVGVVEYVVDGDTIDVRLGDDVERVRLLGVDTPEIAHAATDGRPGNDAECFADEAHAFTAAIVPPGTPVHLERDVVGRDDYGRLLAYVRRDDGVDLNYELVRQGYAHPLTIAPNVARRDRFVQAAREAERDGAGLWTACREGADRASHGGP